MAASMAKLGSNAGLSMEGLGWWGCRPLDGVLETAGAASSSLSAGSPEDGKIAQG